MQKMLLSLVLLSGIWIVSGCALVGTKPLHPYGDGYLYNAFEAYKQFPKHKAMVVAIEPSGKMLWGYASDVNSTEEAKRIAMEACQKAKKQSHISADVVCKLYAVDNERIDQ